MKIAPVSADLLVKLAIGAGAVLAVVYLGRRLGDAAGQAVGTVVDAINPASDQNLVYRAVNAGVQAATGTPDTLGTWIYNVTHPEPGTAEEERFRQLPAEWYEEYTVAP